jgi:hypothetical protein
MGPHSTASDGGRRDPLVDIAARYAGEPTANGGGKMDPAYIRQRVERGPPARPPLWPVLQALPCTLVVWGTDSDVLSEAQARRMVDVLPRGELVRVPGIGHAPTLVEPVVLAALDRFLGRLLCA